VLFCSSATNQSSAQQQGVEAPHCNVFICSNVVNPKDMMMKNSSLSCYFFVQMLQVPKARTTKVRHLACFNSSHSSAQQQGSSLSFFLF
jgi:hypothetical protein